MSVLPLVLVLLYYSLVFSSRQAQSGPLGIKAKSLYFMLVQFKYSYKT